ncbi:MAG: CHASE2 domain-containing protein [Longimicrobiales bacterium]|nr:CHASE2 domain-containing protein [Longimicrobiales bacterium]
MKRSQRYIALVLIALGSVALAILFGDVLGEVTGLQAFENFTLDRRQHTTVESFQEGLGERESEIVMVLFDEFTLDDDTAPWITPFPRAHLASLVDAVAQAGARTIGIDVFLADLHENLNQIDGGNDLLRDAIARAGNVILVSPLQQTDSGSFVQPPHEFFTDVSHEVGTAELPSSYSTFRNGTLAVRSGQGLAPSFALSLWAHSRGITTDSILDAAWVSSRIDLPGLPPDLGAIPDDWKDPGAGDAGSIIPFPIRFYGPPSSTLAADPPGTFQAIGSSGAVTTAMFLPEFFEDKIVLLGTGFHPEDRFRVPFYDYRIPPTEGFEEGDTYSWMYGIEIHANALQNLLDGSYVRHLGLASRLLLMLVVAIASGALVFTKGAAWGAVLTAAVIAGTWVLAFWGWAGSIYGPGGEYVSLGAAGLWMPIATPNLAAALSYVFSVSYVAVVEGREKRFIQGAFGKYLSPDVVAEIFKDPSSLTLGGEKRPLSLLFSDLSGFTTISEEMEAQDLIALLNEYLNDMTQVVFDENGYLDKYIGDAIMAFWNAPKDVSDHADRAMRAAIFMQRRMDDLNDRWAERAENHEPLKVRIGVHTGEVVVGNVGGEDRFDYSAIGDAVNLAARLEPANKTYDTLNMVSEVTLSAGEGSYRVRELDLIVVKGKEQPIKVFELLELEGVELSAQKEDALRHFAAGMAEYKEHRWEEAREHFERAVQACPDDGPSILYVTRCDEHIADPPPLDWDFVVRRTEK